MSDDADLTVIADSADTVEGRLDTATIAQLMAMTRGGIGEPTNQPPTTAPVE